jgi:hypothetical protein
MAFGGGSNELKSGFGGEAQDRMNQKNWFWRANPSGQDQRTRMSAAEIASSGGRESALTVRLHGASRGDHHCGNDEQRG